MERVKLAELAGALSQERLVHWITWLWDRGQVPSERNLRLFLSDRVHQSKYRKQIKDELRIET